MNYQYLHLWLEAPLQSWGSDSKFGRRDTLNFPTKSGVLGLLCCALGAGGEQTELLARMSPLAQTVVSFVRKDKHSNKKAAEPLLKDFQVVGSGYDDKDIWQKLLIPKTTDGKVSNTGGVKLTYRYYLQDAFFSVIMLVPADMAGAFAHALQNPVWDLYLGRKNCAPTDFIYRGLFETESDALQQAMDLSQEKNLIEDFRVIDGDHQGDELLVLNDIPLQFGKNKKYRDRIVTVILQ